MKVVVEKVFELCERRVSFKHDSPVIGACEETEIFRKKHGSYETKPEAKIALNSLVKKYKKTKGWKVSIKSTSESRILFIDVNLDIVLWIKEKVVSERPIR